MSLNTYQSPGKTEANIKAETNVKTEAKEKSEANVREEANVKVEPNEKVEPNVKAELNVRGEANMKAEANVKAEAAHRRSKTININRSLTGNFMTLQHPSSMKRMPTDDSLNGLRVNHYLYCN